MSSRNLELGGRSQDRTADSYRVKVIRNQTKLSDSKGLFGKLGATASVRRSLKISAVAVLAGLLAAPASAQAPVPPAQDLEIQQLCYGWLRLTPKQIAAKIRQTALRDYENLSGGERARASRCLIGTVEAVQPTVRQFCLHGLDPQPELRTELEYASNVCVERAVLNQADRLLPAPLPAPE